MTKKPQWILFSFCLLLLLGCGNIVNGDPESPTTAIWARSASGGIYLSNFYSVAVDSSGAIYSAGYQGGAGEMTYGSGVSATGNAIYNTIIVKYNASGKALWARTVDTGNSQGSFFKSVVVDSAGNIYVAGYQLGTETYTFGPGVTATGTNTSYNAVLVKYNSSGTALWARTVSTGNKNSFFDSVAVDGLGNVYAAGNQAGTGIFTYGTGVSAAGSATSNNVVLVKYDSDGSALWARTVSTGGHTSIFQSVAVDGSGNVYVAGYQYDAGVYTYGAGVSIGGGNSSASNSVIVKYNPDGTAQWARIAVGSNFCQFFSIAVDSSGFVYAVGLQGNGTYNYGNGVSSYSAVINSAVLVRYNADGETQWARSVSTGDDWSIFFSVTVDHLNNIYAGGCLKGSDVYTFGPGVSAAGSSVEANAVLVKYNSEGEAQLARTVSSGSLNSYFRSVAVDSSGYVYAAGEQEGSGTYRYGPGVSTNGSSSVPNVVLVKYSP